MPQLARRGTEPERGLAELGVTHVVLRRELVDTVEEAERVGFLGSPTILIDGTDPFDAPGATPGLSCRLYRTDTGFASPRPSRS